MKKLDFRLDEDYKQLFVTIMAFSGLMLVLQEVIELFGN